MYAVKHNKAVKGTSKKYRPDFRIHHDSFVSIIECDEFAHISYSISNEREREIELARALGRPCVFLRFNPDDFMDRFSELIGVEKRYIILKSYIDYYVSHPPTDNVTVEYLFYNLARSITGRKRKFQEYIVF